MGKRGSAGRPAFARPGCDPRRFRSRWPGCHGARASAPALSPERLRRQSRDRPTTAALMAARAGREPAALRSWWSCGTSGPATRSSIAAGSCSDHSKAGLRRSAAIVTVTPEAAADVRRRHRVTRRTVVDIPNGFEGDCSPAAGAVAAGVRSTILHSGTLTADRPLDALPRALARKPWRDAFRLDGARVRRTARSRAMDVAAPDGPRGRHRGPSDVGGRRRAHLARRRHARHAGAVGRRCDRRRREGLRVPRARPPSPGTHRRRRDGGACCAGWAPTRTRPARRRAVDRRALDRLPAAPPRHRSRPSASRSTARDDRAANGGSARRVASRSL